MFELSPAILDKMLSSKRRLTREEKILLEGSMLMTKLAEKANSNDTMKAKEPITEEVYEAVRKYFYGRNTNSIYYSEDYSNPNNKVFVLDICDDGDYIAKIIFRKGDVNEASIRVFQKNKYKHSP